MPKRPSPAPSLAPVERSSSGSTRRASAANAAWRPSYRVACALAVIAVLSGAGVTFDGSTWLDAPPCTALGGDLTYTIRLKAFLPASASESSTGRAAFCASSATSSTSYVCLGVPDGSRLPELTHRSGSTFYRARGTTPIVDGVARCLVGIADGATLRLYVDGVQAGSTSLAGASPTSGGLCTMGALRRASTGSTPPWTVSSFWIGDVWSVELYDRAISAEEIAAGCWTPPTEEPCPRPPAYAEGMRPCTGDADPGPCRLPGDCPPEELGEVGLCDECLTWSVPEGARWFVIRRTSLDGGGASMVVGSTRYTPADPVEELPEVVRPRWCPAFDDPPPIAGRLYSYAVQSCTDEGGAVRCSEAWSPGTLYRAACHDCDGGEPSLCPGTAP